MQTRTLPITAAALLAALLAFSVGALAARPPDAGNGGTGGGGMEAPDFGDLFVLYRDADGVPILTPDLCKQPIAAEPFDGCVTIPSGECLVPVDPATCAVALGYETYTQEVEFGRTNVARSPDSVFETQLEDAVVRLATADCITLDPAGRLVTSTVADGVVSSAAIDSPLQNAAIYKRLMEVGYLGAEAEPIVLPEADVLDTAARGLGAASDKAGKVGVDMVVYFNQILGLTDESVPTLLPKKCIEVKEEVKGVVQLVQECFLLYTGYGYDRASNFGSLPSPAYIPADDPRDGYFEYLALASADPLLFKIEQGPITTAVFGADPGFTGGNIGGFAQAADDARAVIDFMHSNPVPAGYETPLVCEASGSTSYDVSISDISGLQVPVKMVAGTEGRELTLTVANAGPDAASGTVLLTAVDSDGNSIPTFPRSYSFTLVPGTSQSWTEGFSVDYATTVTWTATADAEFDVNPANDSVTETTVVRGSRGGSHGRP